MVYVTSVVLSYKICVRGQNLINNKFYFSHGSSYIFSYLSCRVMVVRRSLIIYNCAFSCLPAVLRVRLFFFSSSSTKKIKIQVLGGLIVSCTFNKTPVTSCITLLAMSIVTCVNLEY